MHARRTLRGMTDVNASSRRFTWSIEALGNRFAYSVVVAILFNIALGNEVLSLALALVVFLVLTAIVTVGRRNQAGTDRQP